MYGYHWNQSYEYNKDIPDDVRGGEKGVKASNSNSKMHFKIAMLDWRSFTM